MIKDRAFDICVSRWMIEVEHFGICVDGWIIKDGVL